MTDDDTKTEAHLWVVVAAVLGGIAGYAVALLVLNLLVWVLKVGIVVGCIFGGGCMAVWLFKDWMGDDDG